MLNAQASQAAKATGMQLAIEFAGEEWRDRALAELRAWCAIRKAQGVTEVALEEFRAQAKAIPPRHQAWGPLATAACKAGIWTALTNSNGSPFMRAAASEKTHGHFVRVYRIV